MSYDIDFIRVDPEGDILGQAREITSVEAEFVGSAAEDLHRQMLTDDLLKLHPALRMGPDHKFGFSRGCWIASDDGDCPFPDIDIGVRRGFTCISYSADPKYLESIEAIAAVFRRHGYVAYDPQTDELWNLLVARRRFAGTSEAFVEEIQRRSETLINDTAADRPHRPWWRFWR